MTRTPCSDSSAADATSPVWSCTRRAITPNRPISANVATTTGTTSARTARPTCHSVAIMIPSTTTMWIEFMKRTTRPNERKRRMVPRSLMIRDSSWPDSQALWNCIGRRCSWSKRSSRMSVSMNEVAFTMIQRRRNEMNASRAPTASSASPNHSTPSASPSLMGPSTTPPSSSGMEMLSSTPSGAMANENAN